MTEEHTLVQRLRELVEEQIGEDLDYIRAADKLMSQAADALDAAEAKLAKVQALLRDDEQTVEALAKLIHERSDDDGFSVPWVKQSSRYRSQQRRLVRKVLATLRAKGGEA